MKRMIKSSDRKLNLSQVSFDFIHDGNYDSRKVGNLVHEALVDAGVYPEGVDFYSVDYSGYPEYKNDPISQCGADFAWFGDYDSDLIEDNITRYLDKIGIEVIGINFEALED